MKIAPALRIRPASRSAIGGENFEMLRREPIDQRDRIVKLAHDDDGAEFAPRRAGDFRPRQRLELRFDGLLDRSASAGIVGDQDRLRAGIVLGLRQQVGGDPVGIRRLVGEDQHLGRPGDHVDADLAEHQPLGRRDIGIARPDDLGDRRDGFGAVGQRGDRLRAADAINLVDAGKAAPRRAPAG